jgi:DNA-binding transcriptional MerR regulator
MALEIEQLAHDVTAWCTRHRVVPANGQVAADTQVRTLRYYRTLGLLDAPVDGGYTQRHFLQACAVRVLQAEGLPLSRIHTLLYGRSDAELQQVADSRVQGRTPELPATQPATPATAEAWQTYPLSADFLLVARRPGFHLTPEQAAAIQAILSPSSPLL